MPRTGIKFDDYKVKAFLDTNIILEGRPLAELPWQEVDAEGPIIALLTPTAIKEVDSKKQDGRIGKRAREFNKLIAPVATGGAPIVIRESGPRVELALARAVRIPWDQHDDLDPDDGDSCIVAEVLYAKDMTNVGKLLVSQDIKPLTFAAGYDLETLHVSENWLRQMEPSPADKEIQRLKGKLTEYEANQPEFEINIEMPDGEPVLLVRFEDLTDLERNRIERKIYTLNPKHNQARDMYGVMSSLGYYDSTYDGRYEAYRRRVPIFMTSYEERLERLFNQVRFKMRVSNIGKMQAENLLVKVSVSGGWLHDRYIWVSPRGPTAPELRSQFAHILNRMDKIQPRVGRHEIVFKDRPCWQPSFSVTCEDFRHGQDWTFEGIVGIDPHVPASKITVTVSASNFRGEVQEVKHIARKLETVPLSKHIDLDTLRPTSSTPIDEILQRKDYNAIEWKAFPVDDD